MNEQLKLVAPWWYWERQRPAFGAPRNTRPTIQKFDQPDFVPSFAKTPQHSLQFTDEDFVYTYQNARRSLLGQLMKIKDATGPAPSVLKGPLLAKTGIRKLFLDTHKRYYVVVGELRCEAPGFPRENTEGICQAGFVVRRRMLQYDAASAGPAKALLMKIADAQRGLADLAEVRTVGRWAGQQRAVRLARLKADGTFGDAVTTTAAALQKHRTELLQWKADTGAEVIEEGWFPSGFDNIGSWQVIDENPTSIVDEQWYPLYPLLPDSEVEDHEALKHSLYFGLVPTSAFETDRHGTPKFDSSSQYHLRCFVRRHAPTCPRKDEAPDCCGEVFWSKATETYQLAAQNDLVGTSNRPVTIELPDLDELAALATPENIGKFSPVRMVGKQGLSPGGLVGLGSICFFSIPLITLIALFVLNLFLPIVVMIFSLWFLLAFKFCIPPTISLDVGLTAEIDAALQLPDLEIAVDVDVLRPDGTLETVSIADIQTRLAAALNPGFAAATFEVGPSPSSLPGSLGKSAFLGIGGLFSAVEKLARPDAAGRLDLTARLAFEPRVTTEPSPV